MDSTDISELFDLFILKKYKEENKKKDSEIKKLKEALDSPEYSFKYRTCDTCKCNDNQEGKCSLYWERKDSKTCDDYEPTEWFCNLVRYIKKIKELDDIITMHECIGKILFNELERDRKRLAAINY